MNELLDELKKYKPTKPTAFVRIEKNIPAWFRMIEGAKSKTIDRWHMDKHYEQFQFQVRDLSDGRFKIMSLSTLAFRQLAGCVRNLIDNGKNPNNFNFCIIKEGEDFKTTYFMTFRERE